MQQQEVMELQEGALVDGTQPRYISPVSARLLLTKPLEETHQRTDSSVMGAENQSTA